MSANREPGSEFRRRVLTGESGQHKSCEQNRFRGKTLVGLLNQDERRGVCVVPVATMGTVNLERLYLAVRTSMEAFQRAILAAHTRAANRKRAATLTEVPRPDLVGAVLDGNGKNDSEAIWKKKNRAAKCAGA